jgi:hypothetical protein
MSLDNDRGGVAVLRNDVGEFKLLRTYEVDCEAHGKAMSEEARLLAVASEHNVLILSIDKLETPDENPLLVLLTDGKNASYMEVVMSLDHRILFASEEQFQRIGVFDLAGAEVHQFRSYGTVGHIPTGIAPVGLTLSADGSSLYSVSEVSPPALEMQPLSKAEDGKSTSTHPQGLLLRIDATKAISDPTRSIIDAVPAGCTRFRLTVRTYGSQLVETTH